MKLRTVLIVFAILLFTSTVVAQQERIQTAPGPEPEPVDPENVELNLSQIQDRYNQRSDQIPPFVGSIIGDQTITVNLSGVEQGEALLEEDIIGVKTEGVETSDIQWGEYEEPTLKIWITQENIDRLSESSQPSQELKDMLKNKDIRYETYTLGNSIKASLLNLFMLF